MQRTMSQHAAVFRTDELMAEGKAKLAATYAADAGHPRFRQAA
jgi:succinate dehydrogenase / fumarate reductase flavoprotein subunit